MKLKTRTLPALLATASQLILATLLVNPAPANNTVLNGASPRPFYVFAHNPNSIEGVVTALTNGCNALEPDITEITCGGVETLVDFDTSGGGIPDCGETKLLFWCDQVNLLAQQFPGLALVAFDIKPGAAKAGYGSKILDAARNHLNANGVNLNVIYSVADHTDGGVFDHILDQPLGPREGVQVDQEDNPWDVLNYFFGRGYYGNIGYGDGTETPGPDLPRALDGAAFLRATIGEPKAVTYAYVISTESSMNSFINGGVDGLIVTDGSQKELIDLVKNNHPELRMATREDNPFQPLNEAYGLEITTADVFGAGTDSDLTFTLTGCLGSATITVNTGYINALLNSGRMEQGNTDYVTIPSANLGELNSISIHHNGNPDDDDWHLQEIRVSSLRYIGLNVGHTFEYTAVANNLKIQKGDTKTLALTANFAQAIPTIQCPGPMTMPNDLNQCGAVAQFAPIVDGPCAVTAVCTPPSGSFFVVGQTFVGCYAKSATTNSATCMFTVTVQDTQAPVITCPAPITVPNAANQCGAVVSFSPVVQGPCDDVTAICLPVSGTLFSVGQTLVTCYAQSATGPQSLPCTFTVTVLDTQVPVILCPSPSVANATNPVGTVVLYAVTVTDNCPGAIINCTPASGSLFPIGDTTVHCTATDASAHQASCSFNIHVKGAKEQLNDLIALVQGMSAIKPSIRNALLVNLNASLAGLMANNTSTACGALQSFINLVNGQRDKFITSSDADYLVGKATQIRAVIGCK